MLSSRIRCSSLIRNFYPPVAGICELCHQALENLAHILVPHCPRLKEKAGLVLAAARAMLADSELTAHVFNTHITSKDDHKLVQFFLDSSAFSEVIAAEQNQKGILALLLVVTTTWC